MTSNIRLSIHPLIQIHMWHSISVPCRTHKRLTGFSLSQLLHMFLLVPTVRSWQVAADPERSGGELHRERSHPLSPTGHTVYHIPHPTSYAHTPYSLYCQYPDHRDTGIVTGRALSFFTPFTLFTLHPSVSPYYVISDIILEYLHKFFKSAGDHGYVVIMYINIVYLMHLSHDGKWIESIFLILTVWNTSRSHYNHMHWKKLKRKRKKKNQEITNKK